MWRTLRRLHALPARKGGSTAAAISSVLRVKTRTPRAVLPNACMVYAVGLLGGPEALGFQIDLITAMGHSVREREGPHPSPRQRVATPQTHLPPAQVCECEKSAALHYHACWGLRTMAASHDMPCCARD